MNNQYNKDGKKEGLWVKIYDNGVVQEERNYVNGVREGVYKSYYMNGEIEIIKNYKMVIFMENIKHFIVMEN